MDLRDSIKDLLGKGLSGSVVALALGCEASYISQLMENEEFRSAVNELRAKGATTALNRDEKWDKIEDLALERAEKMLPLVSRPTDLIRIAEMANKAKRVARDLDGGSAGSAPIVQIVIPESAAIHFKMNSQSQVVEVEGRSMAALPTKHLQQQLAERKNEREALPNGGVQDVVAVPTVVRVERKKVETILEQIGYADEPVPVPNVLEKV